MLRTCTIRRHVPLPRALPIAGRCLSQLSGVQADVLSPVPFGADAPSDILNPVVTAPPSARQPHTQPVQVLASGYPMHSYQQQALDSLMPPLHPNRIARVDSATITPAQLHKEFIAEGRPVVISTGLLVSPSGPSFIFFASLLVVDWSLLVPVVC